MCSAQEKCPIYLQGNVEEKRLISRLPSTTSVSAKVCYRFQRLNECTVEERRTCQILTLNLFKHILFIARYDQVFGRMKSYV